MQMSRAHYILKANKSKNKQKNDEHDDFLNNQVPTLPDSNSSSFLSRKTLWFILNINPFLTQAK